MAWWQVVSWVVGLVGGTVGFLTFAFKLAETHQRPAVSLKKIPGDGNDTYVIEVFNPCLAPATVREAGLAFGEKKQPLKLADVPGPAQTGLLSGRGRCEFIVPVRGLARCSLPRTKIGEVAKACGAQPTDGLFALRAYCDSAYGGVRSRHLSFSEGAFSIKEAEAKE
jgi:hypothetical protein